MALTLHDRGVFTWPEWAATLADEIKRAQAAGDPDTGETYYLHWLATWKAWSRARALPRRRRCIAIATPGTTPPIARRMASRSSCGRRILASPRLTRHCE